MPIVNGSYSPPNNFTQQYNLGQKKIRADLVDENFNDAAGAINTLLQADANSVHKTGNETINGDKTFNGDVTFNGKLSINGPVELGNQIRVAILQSVFPVGSIYTTTSATNPAALFGFGTWEQIQGRMILGVSGSHPVGQTGGEEAHTLTTNEMPSHAHTRGTMEITGNIYNLDIFRPSPETQTFSGALSAHAASAAGSFGTPSNAWDSISFRASNGWTGATSYEGNSLAHNNMPPFFAAYIWRRTA